MSKRTRLRAGAAAAVLLVTGSVTGCSASGADGETKTIRYQTNAGLVDLSELADALGYFEGTGIKLERVGDVQGGPESLRAVATDQVDYGGAFNGAIAKLASTGAPITAVVSYYGSDDNVNSSLLVKKGSGIDGAEDLIGKKVAVNTLGANAEAIIDTYLEKEGLSQDEIEEVVSDTELVGPYNGGSYVLSDRFIKENPTTTKEFIGAIAKALEYSQTHSVDEVREVMKKYLEEHDRGDFAAALDLWKGTGVPSKGGVISDDDFNLWLDWLEAEGEVDTGSIEPSEIYTNEYNPYAEEK